jgi:hypothetical protein
LTVCPSPSATKPRYSITAYHRCAEKGRLSSFHELDQLPISFALASHSATSLFTYRSSWKLYFKFVLFFSWSALLITLEEAKRSDY